MSSHRGNNFSLRLVPGSGKHGVAMKPRRIAPQTLDAEDLCRRLRIAIAEEHASGERRRVTRIRATEMHHHPARDDKIRRQSSSKLQKPAGRYPGAPRAVAAHPARTGTVDGTKDNTPRTAPSLGEQSHGRNQVRQSRILAESVDIRAAGDRQSRFLEDSMGKEGTRGSIYRDTVPDGPSSKTAAKRTSRISVLEDDALMAGPTLRLITLAETINKHRVDWSQADESREREKGVRPNSQLRKRDSMWSLKGRISLAKQNLDRNMTVVSEEVEQLPLKSTRFGFFARLKRLM